MITQMNCAITAKPVEMQFGGQTRVIQSYLVLDWVQILQREATLLRGQCHVQAHCNVFTHECIPHCSLWGTFARVPAQRARRTHAFTAARVTRRRCGPLPNSFTITHLYSPKSLAL